MAKRFLKIVVVLLVIAILTLVGILLLRIGLRKLDFARFPKQYEALVNMYAEENEIDPLVLYSVIRTESGFNPKAVSNVEARGLMQITEETFDWIKSKIAADEEIVFDDLYDPEVNIRFGSYYFAACMRRYEQDLSTAAAAYAWMG